jgi:hypothetical protein
MGPARDGSVTVDPKGKKCWMDPSKETNGSKWGWKRDPGWQLGTCSTSALPPLVFRLLSSSTYPLLSFLFLISLGSSRRLGTLDFNSSQASLLPNLSGQPHPPDLVRPRLLASGLGALGSRDPKGASRMHPLHPATCLPSSARARRGGPERKGVR